MKQESFVQGLILFVWKCVVIFCPAAVQVKSFIFHICYSNSSFGAGTAGFIVEPCGGVLGLIQQNVWVVSHMKTQRHPNIQRSLAQSAVLG